MHSFLCSQTLPMFDPNDSIYYSLTSVYLEMMILPKTCCQHHSPFLDNSHPQSWDASVSLSHFLWYHLLQSWSIPFSHSWSVRISLIHFQGLHATELFALQVTWSCLHSIPCVLLISSFSPAIHVLFNLNQRSVYPCS